MLIAGGCDNLFDLHGSRDGGAMNRFDHVQWMVSENKLARVNDRITPCDLR